ncbi:alanine--tRNA ligase, partial [bacterium]
SATQLEPLPATHVDTGMGLERIVSVIQGVTSNYRTDLLKPLMDTVRMLADQSEAEQNANITPYRVVADHCRAATFLIADGVVPGNTGRNYVCRMIIRRAARFGGKIGLREPFMARVAETVIENYGDAYPELRRNQATIQANLTREEKRFQRTVDAGMSHLNDLLAEMAAGGLTLMDGRKAFDLYATHGLPLELTRDVAREQGMDVDESGFRAAMDGHRLASGAGKAFGPMGGEDVDVYRTAFEGLLEQKRLTKKGVQYNPYDDTEVEAPVLALFHEGESVDAVQEGDSVEVLLAKTCFYVEAGGQVSDAGTIVSVAEPRWEIRVGEMRRPAAGVIVHVGTVVKG